MGTSSSQRSPRGSGWDGLRALYRTPGVSPRRLLSRLVSALDADFVAGLSDGAATTCMETLAALLKKRGNPLEAREFESAGSLAAQLKREAEETISLHRISSRFGDLAAAALARTVLEVAAPQAAARDAASRSVPRCVEDFLLSHGANGLLAAFLRNYLAEATLHIASRDLAFAVGGPVLPTVSEAQALLKALEAECQDQVARMDLSGSGDVLLAASGSASSVRRKHLGKLLGEVIGTALRSLRSAEAKQDA